jgi:signal transduction histidine kinase
LIVGVGLPVVLLAAGWWLSSIREAQGRRREAMALLHRTAEVVRGVLDASLEEMRVREDARPFDAYNHVYNPPGVVALGDALALSPLARDPEDPRVVGYFQINAGNAVRTPYEKDALARRHARARLVAARIEAPAFAELRSLAHAKGGRALAEPASTSDDDKPQSIAAYNTLQNQIYEELQQKEIEPEKLADLALSKKIPVTTRNDVPWGEGTRGKKRSAAVQKVEAADRPIARPKSRPTPLVRDEEQPVIDYTPFVFDAFATEIVLYRLVSSGGSRSVQGALLDPSQIFDRWMPTVLERHSVASTRPRVVKAGEAAACSLRTEASDILEGIDLCFPADAVASVPGVPAPELGLLFGLVVVVASAIFVTDAAARRADDLARQRGAFISAVSHELRTPLTTLRMHAELLRDGLVSDDKRRKFHDDMVQESVRLSHLVENVLEATRLEEGRRSLRTTHGDLGDAARAIAQAQAPFLQTKGFAVDVMCDDEVPCAFDRQAVEQIVVNLLDNAAKYAADASEKIVVLEVRNEQHAGAASALLRVLDRGPGIPPDEHDKVFQRFHRVQRPGWDHIVGTGLGLALVRELAIAHGGSARALTREGGGCSIEVRLPVPAVA